MALRILIVDPDKEWLLKAKEFFQKDMYDVDIVVNGKDAQLNLYNQKYFATIINSQTKDHSAVQVLKFIRRNHPYLNVIIIYETEGDKNASGLTTVDLNKLGITETITKPFSLEDLSDLLEGHQNLGDLVSTIEKREGQSAEVQVDEADSKFSKLKIDEFYSTQAVLFDIFIKLNSGKYVKILHAGDTFSKERLDRYKNEKGVEFLYFYTKDRKKFIHFNNFLVDKMAKNKQVNVQTKVNMLKNLSEKFIEESFAQGVKPQIVDQGRQVAENIYNVIENQDDLYKVLREFQDFDPNAFTHAFLVTLFSSSIIKQFEWQSKATIETTAMACMFHDIGKLKLPKELMTKKRVEMSEAEFEVYKTHPKLGVEIVEQNRMINNSIKQIILQHHETFNGTGFPNGIKGAKILTLANIVCLADDFVHIMIDDNLKPTEALKKMLSSQVTVARYNSKILENFIKVFVDPAKINKDSATVLPSNSRMVNTTKS